MALAILIFLQMLPATLLAPAIRPLFAAVHGGAEGPMHGFMALNMVGAALAAPLIGLAADRGQNRARLLAILAAADAVLLFVLPLALPVWLVLVLRALEGTAHVGSATLLIVAMAGRGARGGHTMGLAGAAIIAAIAVGSALGGALLVFGVQAPFVAGALLAAIVAVLGPRFLGDSLEPPRRAPIRELVALARTLAAPLGAIFAARFAIGCVVVTFALFAHSVHGLGDTTIGILFSVLTVPFAAATYPAARLGTRVAPALLLGAGAVIWGAALFALPWVPVWGLYPTLAVAGLASAAMFAPVLGYAALVPAGRASAMALVNAAGALGMLLGPLAAGITIGVAKSGGSAHPYRGPFVLATGAVAVWLVAAGPWLTREVRAFDDQRRRRPRASGQSRKTPMSPASGM